MTTRYLIDDLKVEGSRIVVRAHPELTAKYLRRDFFVAFESDAILEGQDEAIITIPFLLNVIPIVWFSGETYRIESLDAELAVSLERVRGGMRRLFPDHEWNGELQPDRIVTLPIPPDAGATGVLFSGGVDSTYTSLRHKENQQLLITVLGHLALSAWGDKSAYEAAVEYTRMFAAQHGQTCAFIDSNLYGFIDYTKLRAPQLNIAIWHGSVQHGLGLAGLCAPLLHHHGVRRLLVASCESDYLGIPWATSPEILDRLRWSGVGVNSDGVGAARQQKLHFIHSVSSTAAKRNPSLNVCLSSVAGYKNCCRCEKCLRTIVGLISEGARPRDYSFEVEQEEAFSILRRYLRRGKLKLPRKAFLRDWLTIQAAAGERFREGQLEGFSTLDARDMRWFVQFDLELYYTRYQNLFKRRRAWRTFKHAMGVVVDLWPPFGRVVRRVLQAL